MYDGHAENGQRSGVEYRHGALDREGERLHPQHAALADQEIQLGVCAAVLRDETGERCAVKLREVRAGKEPDEVCRAKDDPSVDGADVAPSPLSERRAERARPCLPARAARRVPAWRWDACRPLEG